MFSLSGCYYAFYPQAGSQVYAETNPETITIYSEDIEETYEILGPVAAEVPGNAKEATKYLKKKASKMGASAIIKVQLSKTSSISERTGISGIAVKIKES